jgi:hypothetical protein
MQKDLSAAAEFAKRFATEAACRDYLIQLCDHLGRNRERLCDF